MYFDTNTNVLTKGTVFYFHKHHFTDTDKKILFSPFGEEDVIYGYATSESTGIIINAMVDFGLDGAHQVFENWTDIENNITHFKFLKDFTEVDKFKTEDLMKRYPHSFL